MGVVVGYSVRDANTGIINAIFLIAVSFNRTQDCHVHAICGSNSAIHVFTFAIIPDRSFVQRQCKAPELMRSVSPPRPSMALFSTKAASNRAHE